MLVSLRRFFTREVAHRAIAASCTLTLSSSCTDGSHDGTSGHESSFEVTSTGTDGLDTLDSSAAATQASSTAANSSTSTTSIPSTTASDSTFDTDTTSGQTNSAEGAEFEIHARTSPAIPTVVDLRWSTTFPQVARAVIEYGPDDNYGEFVEVDLDAPEHQTLLLGLTASTRYHFRIIVGSPTGETATSADQQIDTGAIPNSLLLPTVVDHNPEQQSPGFTVTSLAHESTAIILNEHGEYVWWYSADMEALSRARMSYSGKYMWLRDTSHWFSRGVIRRVRLDGMEDIGFVLPNTHHDIAMLPDDTIAYLSRKGTCDLIIELDEYGTKRTVFDIDAAFPEIADPSTRDCHANSMHYYPDTDSYTVSLRNENMYLHVSRRGELLWVLGGLHNQFAGVHPWNYQHGHHLFDDRFLFFNNGRGSEPSRVLEYRLSLEEPRIAELVWSYESPRGSIYFGDVQRLDNGNTLVTYSWEGVIHEVDVRGQLVQSMSWPLGGALGYTMRRPSLYGPPPR